MIAFGNHAQGIGQARQHGISSVIVMPADAKVKIDNTRALGAEVVFMIVNTAGRDEIVRVFHRNVI